MTEFCRACAGDGVAGCPNCVEYGEPMTSNRPRRYAHHDRIPDERLTQRQRWARDTYLFYSGKASPGLAPCFFCLGGYIVRTPELQIACAVCEGESRVPCTLCEVSGEVTCRDCFGSGLRVLRCLPCDGTGLRFDPRRMAGALAPDPTLCPRCQGAKMAACERCVLPDEFHRARFGSGRPGPAAAPLPGKWTYQCGACLGTQIRPCTRCHGTKHSECVDCVGRGRAGWQSANFCGACEGSGAATCFRCEGQGQLQCSECDRGESISRCPSCRGGVMQRCKGCLGSVAWEEAAALAEQLGAEDDAAMWRRIAELRLSGGRRGMQPKEPESR